MHRLAAMPPAAVAQRRTVVLPGGPLDVLVRRSDRSIGLRVTIHPVHGVVVSMPPARRRGWAKPDAAVDAFLRDRERWIRRHLERHAGMQLRLAARPSLLAGREVPYLGRPHRVRAIEAPGLGRSEVERVGDEADELVVRLGNRDRRGAASVLEGWLRERAMVAVEASVERHGPWLGATPAAVVLRDPRSRWGSCSPNGRIMLSWRLVLAPPEALDSVVVHELCHLRHHDHGRRFTVLLDRSAPDHRRWRRWLTEHAAELRAALSD